MHTTDIMLFFLVLGDAIGDSFSVDITGTSTIGHLKELIWEKKKNTFKSVDANSLVLLKTLKYDMKQTLESVKNYDTEYDIVLVLFTNRYCTGTINIDQMPQLLLIYTETYLSPTFAH
ncbi:4287_t:CDS:2 [Diversispora eburnea]|uniref:4287_t:CDS:1 n=1 Tax=Diversispora eburnea TaxID=1213867 RepID=A0A9N9BHE6_9GLOM|nr:4287_t:CDS:2 [Diversispora eburnea]